VINEHFSEKLGTWSLVIATAPGGSAYVNQPAQSDAQPTNPSTTQSPQELQQLVAPIALYPDALVSQILAGATYPTEIVEADSWMQGYPNLAGQELANEVDKQPWDPSVKALTQFPSVLASMDKNLSWTSSLGDAYANEPQDVMDAVQVLRARAQQAGNLKNNKQEKVETQGTRSSSSLRNLRLSTYPHTIRGSFTELRSLPGRGGIGIRVSTCRGLALALA
jgi:hypothetical protein